MLRNLEMAMIEGCNEIITKVIDGSIGTEGIESIKIIDAQGKDVFRKNEFGREDVAVKDLQSGKERLIFREKDRFICCLALKNSQKCHSCHDSSRVMLGAVRFLIL